MTPPTTVVLLGGSGLGPWAWGRVTPLLEARGFDVVLPQLRATGDLTPATGVTLWDWAEDLLSALESSNADNTVLVAHSFAGYVVAAALERNPRIARTAIFLDAALPTPNRSWFDVMGPQTEAFMSSLAVDSAIPFFTFEQLDHIYPGHGISRDDWDWMTAHIAAQPIRTYAQPAITREIDPENTHLRSVRCLRTTPPVADIANTTRGWIFRTLATGHWPMITDPALTAAVIEELTTP